MSEVRLRKRVLKAYNTIGHPVAFSGIGTVADYFNITDKKAKEILEYNDTYTIHREYKKPRTYNPYYVHGRREHIQGDLIDIRSFRNRNDNVQYIALLIDIFTKKIWLFPMTSKTAIESRDVFQQWLQRIDQIPEIVRTDNGKEYYNRLVQQLLQSHNITWEPAFGTSKASIAERANKSIQIIIYKYMHAFQTTRYVDVLDDIAHTYNSRQHRTLKGMTPNEADRIENEHRVHKIHRKRFRKIAQKRKQRLPFGIGDIVRIKIDAKKISTDRRAYAEQFKGEYFRIVGINRTMPIAMYYIRSEDTNERIEGGFYAEELQKVRGSIFKIDKVIARRGQGRNRQLKVRWKYYGPNHDSWINERDVVQDFRQNQ